MHGHCILCYFQGGDNAMWFTVTSQWAVFYSVTHTHTPPPKQYQVVALLGTGLCVGRRSSHVLASLRTPNVFIVSAPVITRCHFCIQALLKENTTAVHLHKDMHSTVYFCVIIYADVSLKKIRNSKYNNVGKHYYEDDIYYNLYQYWHI